MNSNDSTPEREFEVWYISRRMTSSDRPQELAFEAWQASRAHYAAERDKLYIEGVHAGIRDGHQDFHQALDETKFADLMDGVDWTPEDLALYIIKLEELTKDRT